MSVVSLSDHRRGDPDAARCLRDIADKVEAGEIVELIVVGNNIGECCYETFAIWEDRWRMLGAIENAKARILAD